LYRVNFVSLGDCVNNVLPLDNLAEDRMLVVEPRCGNVGYEELAAVRVGAGVGHRERSGTCVTKALVELVRESIAGTAGAVATGVAPLNHEIVDNSMENEAIVERLILACICVEDTLGESHEVHDG